MGWPEGSLESWATAGWVTSYEANRATYYMALAVVPAMPELDEEDQGRLRVKLLTSRAFMPVRASEQSAGLDLFASEKLSSRAINVS